jgi:hypothetical protein
LDHFAEVPLERRKGRLVGLQQIFGADGGHHVTISPQLGYECFLGIDDPSTGGNVAARHL